MKHILTFVVVGGILASSATAGAGDDRRAEGPALRTFQMVKAAKSESPRFGQILTVQEQQAVPALPEGNGATAEPMPLIAPEGQPVPHGQPVPTQTVQLYPYVKYEDLDNRHPCAVTKIVAVPDPCKRCRHHGRDCCQQCGPGCVYVQICVPPCGCPKVKVKRHGRKIEFDYGDYEVEIESKNGVVEVDYDDGLFAKLF